MSDQRDFDEFLTKFKSHYGLVREELHKVVIGQDEVIEQLLAAVFTGGHCLLVGVPGLAKTLLVSTLARVLDVNFKRIQFTPDLMPSDITGTNVLDEDEHGRREFRFVHGPVFTNVLLADEINRTPPKTAGRAASGDAGKGGFRRPDDLRPAGPVLRHRDPEPDRAGGHLPAAGGPAGPVHVQT